MKQVYYLIFIFLFLAACQESSIEEEISPIVQSKISAVQYARTGNFCPETVGIFNAQKIIKKDSLYILLTPKGGYRFAIYNIHNGNITRLVPAGKKEGQGLYFLGLTLNGNRVSAFDFGNNRLVEIDLNQYMKPDYIPLFTEISGTKIALQALRAGKYLISTGLYSQGRYCCTDITNNTDSYSVGYPECNGMELNDTLKSILFASNYLAINPSQDRLVCANIQNGCLDICKIGGEGLSRINEIHLNRPKVKVNPNKKKERKLCHPITYSQDNIFGFCDLSTSEDYIFALYSGKTYRKHRNGLIDGNIILVFDWNGNHVRTYHLDYSCSSISYDQHEKALYVLAKKGSKSEIVILKNLQ